MTHKSSDQLLESLSALVDNEASELEVRRILKNVESNPEVRERWHRYNMIGAVLRKETNVNCSGDVDLTQSISAALLTESAFDMNGTTQSEASLKHEGSVQKTSPVNKGMFDFIAKSAVAASFAGALVLGFNMFGANDTNDFGNNTQLTAASSGQRTLVDPGVTAAPLGFDLPRVESRTVSTNSVGQPLGGMRDQAVQPTQVDDLTDVATQNLLNELLIHHSARASSNGSLGIMPFARVSQLQSAEASK